MDNLESFVVSNPIVGCSIVLPCCHVVATPFLVTLLFNLGPLGGNSNVGQSILLPCCHVMATPLLVTLFFCLFVTSWQLHCWLLYSSASESRGDKLHCWSLYSSALLSCGGKLHCWLLYASASESSGVKLHCWSPIFLPQSYVAANFILEI